jgi:hypothetical protein
MSVSANGKRLSMLTLQLWNQWEQTKEHWKDARSQEFEQKYLEELRAGVDRAAAVIEQLDKLVMKVKRDCE